MYIRTCAKINLGLNVTRKRPDGYHDLETVFYPIPLYDDIDIAVRPEQPTPYSFRSAGVKVDGTLDSNLVIRVCELLKAEGVALPPLDISLYKRIPTGAGLGGGSSDAAAMMKLLNETFDLSLSIRQMEAYVGRLGADCPFFIQAKPVFASGIGDVFDPITLDLSGWILVLVKPEVAVPTALAYKSIVPQQPTHSIKDIIQQEVSSWKTTLVNDFEQPIFTLYPRLKAIKEELYRLGATYAAMSGSGSTLFGLFKTPQAEIDKYFPDCFVFQKKIIT